MYYWFIYCSVFMNNLHSVNVYLRKQIHSFLVSLMKKRVLFLILLTVTILISLFLYEAEPYTISLWHDRYKLLKLSGYGVIYSGIVGCSFCFVPRNVIYPESLNRLTILKLILLFLILITIIGFFSRVYTSVLYEHFQFIRTSFILTIRHIFFVNLFPVSFYIIFLYLRDKPVQLLKAGRNDKVIVVFDKVKFVVKDILYLKADGNYIIVYYLTGGKAQKKEGIRCSLKQADMLLSIYSGFIRVHKSYLVNLNQVKSFTSVNNSMDLIIDGINEEIPVRRSLQRTVKYRLHKLT